MFMIPYKTEVIKDYSTDFDEASHCIRQPSSVLKVSQDGASLSMFGEVRTSINHRHLDDPYFSHKKVQCIDLSLSNNINMRKIYGSQPRFCHHREPASTVLTSKTFGSD